MEMCGKKEKLTQQLEEVRGGRSSGGGEGGEGGRLSGGERR